MPLFSRKTRQRSGRATRSHALECLETRSFLNAAPIAPGFPDTHFPGDPDSAWPRHTQAAVYDGQVPTVSITYEQLLALTQATDAEGDTIHFLLTASVDPMVSVSNYDSSQPHGILDSNGQVLSTDGAWNMARFDPDNDGVPDGDYVLEPGETWHWRGVPNTPFTGSDFGPPWGGPGDFGILIHVTDSMRPLEELAGAQGYISFTGNTPVRYQKFDDSTVFANVDLGHRGTMTMTYEKIISELEGPGNIIDPEGGQVVLVIQPGTLYDDWTLDKGTLTVGSVNINDYFAAQHPTLKVLPDHLLTPDSPLILRPGESVTFSNSTYIDQEAFRISLWDGLSGTNYMGGPRAVANDNTPPALDEAVDLGSLGVERSKTWTYAELVTLLSVTDADGDELTLSFGDMDDIGEMRLNGHNFDARLTLEPGDTLTYTASGFRPGVNGFYLHVGDGWTSVRSLLTFSDADFAYGGALGDTAAAPGAVVAAATAPFPFGSHLAAWRNAAGELIISLENLAESSDAIPGARTLRNLSAELGLPVLTGDPVATSQYGGQFYLPTEAGLLMLGLETRQDTEAWNPGAGIYLRNFSIYNPQAPTSELTLVTPPRGLLNDSGADAFYGVVGYEPGGDMVVMYYPHAMYSVREDVVVFNITDAVIANSNTMPTFEPGFVAYAQSWGGYNVVGLNSGGDVIGVWTGEFYLPGEDGYNSIDDSVWQVSNLSDITGAPVLTGSLSVFSTDWNAINIIGTTQGGHAVASWWSPAMGPGNWAFVDFTQDFGGVPLQPGSLTGWVTPWGALNVAGVDDQGQTHAYWWVHNNISEQNPAGWYFTSLNAPSFAPGTRLVADSVASIDPAAMENIVRISIYGTDEDGQVGMTYWMPSIGGTWGQAWL